MPLAVSGLGAITEFDTGERDAAQNEGCDGGDKVHALGQTAGGDAAAVLGHGQNIGKRVATDGVDAAGPTLLAERPRGPLQLRPLDDLGRPQGGQIVRFARPPGGGNDAVAEPRQQDDGDAAHPAGRAGDDHGALAGRDAIALERQHGQHGGVARRADCHGLPGAERRRPLDQPVALDAGAPGVTAIMGLTDAPAVEHHLIARLELGIGRTDDGAGEVDAGDHRPASDHGRLAGEREPVLIVNGCMAYRDGDVPLHQVAIAELLPGKALPGLRLSGQQGLEVCHYGLQTSLIRPLPALR